MIRRASLLLALAAGCSSGLAPDDGGADLSGAVDLGGGDRSAGGDGGAADWVVALDPAAAVPLPPALLGQYDLSGALFRYDLQPGLIAAMKQAGLSEWRVGLERWESGTRLLPALTDGTACNFPGLPASAFAPTGSTDLDLVAARDWFSFTDGQPVTLAMTADDARYDLAYVRSTVDVATAFGASPFLNIDSMPRALATNQTPSRLPPPPNCDPLAALCDPCNWTWSDLVENVEPADPQVFAAAVVGLVRRLVEGSGAEPGRPVEYLDFWNEPELPYAWDKRFESKGGLDDFFTTAFDTLVALDAYRKGSPSAAAQKLKLGVGSFGRPETAAAVLQQLDLAANGGTTLPLDFVSFHAYDDDPLAIVQAIEKVESARAATTHFRSTELALTEWGPRLDGVGWSPTTMDTPLLASTVIALGAGHGLSHAHHTLFWAYYPGLPFGLLDGNLGKMPLFYAYALLAPVAAPGASRLPPAGHEDGSFDAGQGAVLAARDAAGTVRVLLVNRQATARTVAVTLAAQPAAPSAVTLFDDPAQPPRAVAPSPTVTVPPRSLALLTF
jgi:hypothetical protein